MADQTTSIMPVRGCNIGLMRGGSGQPLVILHGASGAGTWLPFMRSLADTYDVIVPEHPGFGASDQLDLHAVHLVGISLGGWIAAELAIRSTQRLSSLTLVDAAGIHVPGVEQIDTFLRTDEQRIRDFFHDQTLADEMVARLLKPELEDVTMKNRVATARVVWQPRGYDPNLHKWLHRIDVPTLLVWGANDRLFPRDYAFAWQRLIPGSKVVIVPECGHVPHVEKPSVFVSELQSFINGMRAAA
jgi:pimeloyl-ACP methyl ester carboxylesterase